jgi:hypothetical protein
MMRLTPRARRATAALAAVAGAWLLGACDPKQELLAPQQPGVISPTDVQNATGAEAIYVGTLGRFERAMNGGTNNLEGLWNEEGLFTDEFKSADTFSQRNDADQRNLATNDGDLEGIYDKVQQVRGFARGAINALEKFDPSPTGVEHTAEMYFVMGYTEMQLSSVFCNGIPFGETVDGVPTYTAPITDANGSTLAISRLDTAIAMLGTPTDDATKNVLYATLIAKARAQLDLGNFDGAAATVASVPTNFSYTFNYSITTNDNMWWIMLAQVKRYTVGDSVDNGTQVLNAIPFVSLKDPRVPTTKNGTGEDQATTFFNADIWGRDDPVALAWGGDARLIEAEDHLHNGDIPGMMVILNALRASSQTIGAFVTPVMAPLAIPASPAAARALFFREKALWQFGRGYRMDDLRRQVRQYGLAQDQVFPSGTFILKTQPSGDYGTQTNFPVTDDEKANPNFHGCLDTNA